MAFLGSPEDFVSVDSAGVAALVQESLKVLQAEVTMVQGAVKTIPTMFAQDTQCDLGTETLKSHSESRVRLGADDSSVLLGRGRDAAGESENESRKKQHDPPDLYLKSTTVSTDSIDTVRKSGIFMHLMTQSEEECHLHASHDPEVVHLGC